MNTPSRVHILTCSVLPSRPISRFLYPAGAGWRSSVWGGSCLPPRAAYPGVGGREQRPFPPARPCSRWGLLGRPCRQGRRCALTAPFHPRRGLRPGNLPLCSALPRVTPPGRYPAPCSMESGLSSDATRPRSPGRLGTVMIAREVWAVKDMAGGDSSQIMPACGVPQGGFALRDATPARGG